MTVIEAPTTSVLDELRAQHEDVSRALLHLQHHEALLPASLYPPHIQSDEVWVMCRDRSEFEHVVAVLALGVPVVEWLDNLAAVAGSLRVWVRQVNYGVALAPVFETAVSCVSHRFGPERTTPTVWLDEHKVEAAS